MSELLQIPFLLCSVRIQLQNPSDGAVESLYYYLVSRLTHTTNCSSVENQTVCLTKNRLTFWELWEFDEKHDITLMSVYSI